MRRVLALALVAMCLLVVGSGVAAAQPVQLGPVGGREGVLLAVEPWLASGVPLDLHRMYVRATPEATQVFVPTVRQTIGTVGVLLVYRPDESRPIVYEVRAMREDGGALAVELVDGGVAVASTELRGARVSADGVIKPTSTCETVCEIVVWGACVAWADFCGIVGGVIASFVCEMICNPPDDGGGGSGPPGHANRLTVLNPRGSGEVVTGHGTA